MTDDFISYMNNIYLDILRGLIDNIDYTMRNDLSVVSKKLIPSVVEEMNLCMITKMWRPL